MSIDLSAIKERLAAAASEPWEIHYPSSRSKVPYIIQVDSERGLIYKWIAHMEWDDADAVFIAHAPEDIAALLAEIERLTSLAHAADAWAQAIAEINGVQAAEQRLLEAVKAWKQGEVNNGTLG